MPFVRSGFGFCIAHQSSESLLSLFWKGFLMMLPKVAERCQRVALSISKIFPLAFSVFRGHTDSISFKIFSRLHLSSTPRSFLRKLFNRPSMKSSKCFKLLNHFIGKTFLFVILVQNPALSFSVNNVFRNRGKSSLLVLPISAKITGTALLNSPKVQFFYSMCHYRVLCRHITIMA